MPLVVMEALANGCAVVASRVSGIEDVRSLNRASEVLGTHEIGDVDGAVNEVLGLLSTESTRRRAAAYRLAAAEFSIDRCVDRYVEVRDRAKARGQPVLVGRARSWSGLGVASRPLATLRRTKRWLAQTLARRSHDSTLSRFP
jgi:hypothetical protein